MRGFCQSFNHSRLNFFHLKREKRLNCLINFMERVIESTSLKEATASITSFVKVLPTPDDPIKTVGLIAL